MRLTMTQTKAFAALLGALTAFVVAILGSFTLVCVR